MEKVPQETPFLGEKPLLHLCQGRQSQASVRKITQLDSAEKL
jgi:hypothetical protein